MKLATLADGTRDGRLVVVSRDNQRYVEAAAPTLQAALDDWAKAEPALRAEFEALQSGERTDAFPVVEGDLAVGYAAVGNCRGDISVHGDIRQDR